MPCDTWQTPKEIFHALDAEFDFGLDAAASHSNALCSCYFTESDDSLSKDWEKSTCPLSRKWVWCNPPYSNPLPWVMKAIETQRNGAGVVMLLNADTSTQWYLKALPFVSERRWINGYYSKSDGKRKFHNGRISFIDGETGQPVNGNSKAQFILVFDPHRIGARLDIDVSLNDLLAKGREVMKRFRLNAEQTKGEAA